jgi:hypothetical protein
VCIEQVLARLLLDSERYDSASWKLLDQSKSEGAAASASAACTPAQPVVHATVAEVGSRQYPQSNIELATAQESQVEREVGIIICIAEKLKEAIAISSSHEKALTDAVKQFAESKAEAVKEIAAAKAKDTVGSKGTLKSSNLPALASPLAAAPAPVAPRKAAAVSISSFAPKVVKADPEDDSVFDAEVTPDAPVLKYGRNGVPELRQVMHSIDQPICHVT